MEIPQSEMILVRAATRTGEIEECDEEESPEKSVEKCPDRRLITRASRLTNENVQQSSIPGASKLNIDVHDSAIFSDEENENAYTTSRASLRTVNSNSGAQRDESATQCGKSVSNPLIAKKNSEILSDPPPGVQWFKNAFTQMGKTDIILIKDLKWACKEYKVNGNASDIYWYY